MLWYSTLKLTSIFMPMTSSYAGCISFCKIPCLKRSIPNSHLLSGDNCAHNLLFLSLQVDVRGLEKMVRKLVDEDPTIGLVSVATDQMYY